MADENKPGASGSAGGPPEKVEVSVCYFVTERDSRPFP